MAAIFSPPRSPGIKVCTQSVIARALSQIVIPAKAGIQLFASAPLLTLNRHHPAERRIAAAYAREGRVIQFSDTKSSDHGKHGLQRILVHQRLSGRRLTFRIDL
jgi:hypothetical protein